MSEIAIPQQRSDEEGKPNRVITTYVVTITLNESILRHKWRGKTEVDILEHIQRESTDEQIQEFVDEIQSIDPDDKRMLFVRHVKIVDPN